MQNIGDSHHPLQFPLGEKDDVSLARRPEKEEAVRWQKSCFQNKKKIRARLFPSRDHDGRTETQINTRQRRNHKSKDPSRQIRQRNRLKDWKNRKSRSHPSRQESSQHRLQPQRRNNQRRNNRNLSRTGTGHITARPAWNTKRSSCWRGKEQVA